MRREELLKTTTFTDSRWVHKVSGSPSSMVRPPSPTRWPPLPGHAGSPRAPGTLPVPPLPGAAIRPGLWRGAGPRVVVELAGEPRPAPRPHGDARDLFANVLQAWPAQLMRGASGAGTGRGYNYGRCPMVGITLAVPY